MPSIELMVDFWEFPGQHRPVIQFVTMSYFRPIYGNFSLTWSGNIQIIKVIHNHVVNKNPADNEGLTPRALLLANPEQDVIDIVWE